MKLHYCEVCGAALDQYHFEFCYRCKKYLCIDFTEGRKGCAQSHPHSIGYFYCQMCLNHLFLCRGCGQYRTRGGRFPLLEHMCEECSRHAR